MSIGEAEIEFVRDLFAGIGDITTRKMMGGLSIYADGKIFAMMHSDARLYLKATGEFAKRLEAAGGALFTYAGKNGKEGHMNYWTLPDAALDEPARAADWARQALRAAYGEI